jgi:undecaprenyl-diphosphatase
VDALFELDRRRAALIVLSSLPPAACALLLERPIERRLGTPATTAAGLLLGSAAMVLADGAPQERGREDAGAGDALWLGLAQATALVPGVSRNGATLVAARLRRFRREDANALSRHVALPIIFAVGVGASFASTLASTWLIRQVERDRSLLPYAAYRAALAGAVLVRAVRKNRSR